MFLRAVNARDHHNLGILVEDVTTESGLTDEWDDVRNNVNQFMKRKQWLGNEERKTPEPEPLHRSGTEEQPRSCEKLVETVNLLEMEQLLQGMKDIKIAIVKMAERPATSRYRDSWCIWCDSAEHVPRNCNELKEALRHDLVYYEGG